MAAPASLLVITPAAHPQPAAVAPATVSSVVEQYRDTAHVPGVAVAVTRGDRVILARGFGHTADGQEVTATTVMAMASVSKSFTALAVVQLAEQGRLELDQPVQRYLPEFVTADPRGARITARQLLDQTSGLTDAGVSQFTRPQPESLRDSVADFRDAELTSPPGSQWAYYNPNYQIAARLVEVVSGQPFDEYLADHVFTPLAMNDSRSIGTDDDLPPTAHGHLKLLGHPIPAAEPTAFGAGSGGVLSTAEDMTSWLIMQNRSTPPGTTAVVSPESLKTMHSPSSSVSGDYALGWSVGRTPSGAPLVSHGGDLFTSTTCQALLPESGYGIAVMANTGLAYGDASAIGKRLVALIDGEPAAPASAQTVAVDGVLLGIALLALALGTIGFVRARRWATTHTIRRALIGVPLLLAPLVVLVLFPAIVRALYRGRDITWTQAFYLYPSFMILLIALSAATTLVGGARLVWKARLSEPGSRP
ncbi:serine hydrolase [Pseudonocardia sp. MH-G8]|nr:serine hydrolase [Pseudonocardia sp. MH-G8]